MQVSLFNGFADKNPKPITIREVVEIIRADQRLQVLTDNHRRYRAAGDTARADAEKQHMPCYSVAVLFSGGKQQKHIVGYTGMSIVDLDHIPSERMAEVLEKVQSDEHTLLAYTTISGEGVRVIARFAFSKEDNENRECLLRADKSSSALYTKVFAIVNSYYENLTGLSSDEKCKNATRISGMAHDPEVYYNPDAVPIVVDMTKKSVGRPRKGRKAERVEATVLRELERRGVAWCTLPAHTTTCYMMNRYGVSESDCTAWALDRFADYQAEGNDVASIVRSCYLQTEEHGTARPPKAVSDKQATVAQIEAFLAERVQLRRNVVTGFVEVREEHSFRQFTDDDRNSLWRALSKELGVRVVRQDISAVVKSDFSPRYHPFEDYINRLQPWDGVTDHIGRLASSVTVKGDQEYFARCFKKWLVAFIAAIFDPEEVNHEILVFIGRQGSYKSTWFHYLLPPELRQYFLPKLMSSAGITKDDLFKIAQSGLVCLEEIDNMKQRDLNQLKAITTMRTINERRSYGEFNEFHRHIASFCATGNNRFFLTDPTGNRRFLTFEVESIVPPQTYDYGYEGVYAQAYTLWRQGFRYWFNDEENAEINRHVNSLYRAFCLDTGKRMRINDLYIIIESDFYPEYHPLRDYLESLPAWNGIDYIDQVASMVHVMGCEQEMHNRFFKQWMVAMVAAWLEPDKTNHEILTYIGPQGIYKSTFVRHLLPTELSGYFSTKNFAGRMTKDDRLELTEMALISLEELDSLQSAELNQLKAITTDPTVNERAAYSRYKERRAHIASFCATGNNPRFLTDLTDNRRWLPFLVRDIDSPWTHPLPYTQLYAQAYTLYREGFRYWFDADDNAELSRHNRQFEEPCIEEELVLTYLRHPVEGETGEFLTATRIIELVGQYVRTRLSPKRMAMVMNRLGFEQRRTHAARGWIVVILTGDDIKNAQRMNVHRSRKDG